MDALVQLVSDRVVSTELASGGNELDPQRHTMQSHPSSRYFQCRCTIRRTDGFHDLLTSSCHRQSHNDVPNLSGGFIRPCGPAAALIRSAAVLRDSKNGQPLLWPEGRHQSLDCFPSEISNLKSQISNSHWPWWDLNPRSEAYETSEIPDFSTRRH